MRYFAALALLIAGAAQVAVAETAPFEWTKARFDLVAAGDPETGKELAKELRCHRCHNRDGISDDPDIPSIAGQRATYLYKQLHDFANGVRVEEDMAKVAKKMSEEDMAHVGAWYASLDRPAKQGGQPLLVVKVCDSCHDAEVVKEDNHIEVAPVIAGQVREYLERSIRSFKQMERSNDLFQRMRSESHKLNDADIAALARYYGAPPAN